MDQSDPKQSEQRKHRRRWVRRLIAVAVVVVVLLIVDVGLEVRSETHKAWRLEHLYQLDYDLDQYAYRHNGNYPDSLESLIAGGGRPWVLASGDNGDTPAKGATTQAILADFARSGHLSYVYLGGGLTDATATSDTVIAYEIPTEGTKQTSVILFGQRRIERLNLSQTAALMRATSATTRPVKFAVPP